MIVFLTAFFASVLAVWLIIRSEHLHHHLTADSDLDGVQKFHVVAVPRVGGLGILIGMLASASWLSLLLSVLFPNKKCSEESISIIAFS